MQTRAVTFVEVAVFAPLPGTFTYQWPEHLGESRQGIRVRVPFGKGSRTGLVMSLMAEAPESVSCKPVLDRLDDAPLLPEAYSHWLARSARSYLSTLGEMCEAALAWAQDDGRRFRCAEPEQLKQFDALLAAGFPTRAVRTLKKIRELAALPDTQWRLQQAMAAGVVEEVLEDLPALKAGHESIPSQLTEAQQAACEAVLQAHGCFRSFLLFGATGSGKTEVYLRCAESLIGQGGKVLILVPEIGLTPMWLSRLAARFPRITSWHSAMTPAEKQAVRARLHEIDVLVGTRSALFLPLPGLSMIVVDEEHDNSFKQMDGVHYSARDMALLLGQELKIPVLLGSATPSLESWRQVQLGSMQCLKLPERISSHQAIVPRIVDMRVHQREAGHELFSPALLKALKTTQESGQQSILFLNRRGYAPALQCTACGDVTECPACSLRLTLHRKAGQLRCHSCGFVRRAPRTCEACGEDALMPLGAGTEKLEDTLHAVLPELRFARFDRDAVQSHGKLMQVLEDFVSGKLDCLIGTQMLVKGHHFPNVTLVGVINADLGLSLPDFRAGERWWQQMTQVVGRAGRGDMPGEVIIQTCNPDAPWLARIGDSYAESILNEELGLREALNFPPYARWVRIVFSAMDAGRAMQAAGKLAEACRHVDGIQVTGPMACALDRLAGRFRVELILRDPSRKILPWKLAPLLEAIPVPSGVRRKVDVDPQDLM